jgi:hypothetical protein
VSATGVVADHPAKGTLGVCSRVRTEGEVVALSGGAQGIEDNTWLDAGELFLRIEFKESAHVLRYVENDSGVAGLSG